MAPRMPRKRGFTVAEKRSITFEKVALWVVFLVAVVAATVSFIALTWVGSHMRLGTWAAPLIPIIIDGFGIACSVGIVRSTAEGKPWRDRASEWVGLFFALGLSVIGNVAHVLDVAPTWLLVTVAVAIPTIVAYSIHVYGRAMVQGLSARIMVDDPDTLVIDGPDSATAVRAPEPRRASPASAPATPTVAAAAAPRAETRAQVPPPIQRSLDHARAQSPAARAQSPAAARVETTPTSRRDARDALPVALPADNGKAMVEAEVRASYAQDPTSKPDASALHKHFQLTCNPATSRRWVQAEWDRLTANGPAQPTPAPQQDSHVIDLADRQSALAARS